MTTDYWPESAFGVVNLYGEEVCASHIPRIRGVLQDDERMETFCKLK